MSVGSCGGGRCRCQNLHTVVVVVVAYVTRRRLNIIIIHNGVSPTDQRTDANNGTYTTSSPAPRRSTRRPGAPQIRRKPRAHAHRFMVSREGRGAGVTEYTRAPCTRGSAQCVTHTRACVRSSGARRAGGHWVQTPLEPNSTFVNVRFLFFA